MSYELKDQIIDLLTQTPIKELDSVADEMIEGIQQVVSDLKEDYWAERVEVVSQGAGK